MQQILDLLEKLINFESVTPKGKDAVLFIAEYLKKLGFTCLVKEFGPDKQQVTNLYAYRGDCAPNICFAGHIDVVPPGDENLWRFHPFRMQIEQDKVYGRGAVDMKGAIACFLAAINNYLDSTDNSRHRKTISVLLTTDEEGDRTYGLKKMLEYIEKMHHKIDFCILGEPTCVNKIGDTIKIGRRGSINFDLKVKGKQGHVAYPEKALNPIPVMVAILQDLEKKKFDRGSLFFQESNLEITAIDCANPTRNVIPQSISAKFNIRFNDNHTPESLAASVEKVIFGHNADYDIQYKCSSLPFIQDYSQEMQHFTDIVADACAIMPEISTSGGTSDAEFIHKYTRVVEFGLNCNAAHKTDEYTEISDLQKLYNVYYDSLVKLYTNS